MGDQFTAADVVIGANLRWGMMFKMIPERKEFVDYVARLEAAPGAAARRGEGQGLRRRLTPHVHNWVSTMRVSTMRACG